MIKNSLANIGAYAVSLAIGLFYTPFLVRHLGVELYGLVPLISSMLVWLSLITIALNWSVGRYLILEEEQQHAAEVNRIFNTSLFLTLGALSAVLCLGTVLAQHVDAILRIPPAQLSAARTLLLLMVGAFAVGLLSGVFEVAFFCRNRYDLRSLLQIIKSICTVTAVMALFSLLGSSIVGLGWVNLAVAVVLLLVTYLLYAHLMPDIQISLHWFSWPWFSRMFGNNVWVLVDQVGTTLMLGMDLFLANRFFGSKISGEYALVLQWAFMLKAIITACNVFSPTYVRYVAKNDIVGLQAYALRSCRFIGTILALPIGILLGVGGDLFKVWLGRPIASAPLLLLCLVAPLAINAAVDPLYGIWQAFYKVKIPCIATLLAGVIGITLCVVLVHGYACGVWAVAIASSTAFTLRNFVFTIPYAARLMGASSWPFIKECLFVTLAVAVVAGLCLGVRHWIPITNWGKLILVVFPVCLLYALWGGWRLISRQRWLHCLQTVRHGIVRAQQKINVQ